MNDGIYLHERIIQLSSFEHVSNFFIYFVLDLLDVKEVTYELKENGLVTKHIKDCILRFSPALNITEEQLRAGLDIIVNTINSMPLKSK